MDGNNFIKRLLVIGFIISILLGEAFTISIGDRRPALLYLDIYFLISVYIFMLLLFKNVWKIKVDRPMFIVSLLYILANGASIIINGSDLLRGVLSVKNFLNGFLIYIIVYSTLNTDRDANWIFYSLLFLGSILSLQLIVSYYLEFIKVRELSKDTIDIGWGRSNYLASFIALFIPINVGFIITRNQFKSRVVFITMCLLMFLGLAITMSKGAMLSLTVVLIGVIPFLLETNSRIKYVGIIIAIFTFLLLFLPNFMLEILNFNIQSIQFRRINPDYTRIELIRTSWNDFFEHPLFGIGPFESRTQFLRYQEMPHNFVLQSFAELGLCGGVIFITFIVIVLFRAFKNCIYHRRLENIFIFAGIIVTLLHGLLELTFQGPQYMCVFWLLNAGISFRYKSISLNLKQNVQVSFRN